jgi:hypothetical protein
LISSARLPNCSSLASIFGAEIRLRFRAVLCLLMLAGLGSVPLLVLPG